jgi:hypothetical protein
MADGAPNDKRPHPLLIAQVCAGQLSLCPYGSEARFNTMGGSECSSAP